MLKKLAFLTSVLVLVSFISVSLAHKTQTVGEGENEVKVIVGFVKEPPFTEERTGLDLIIRRAGDDSPVENLQDSLIAELVAPDGRASRLLTLRPQYGKPGYYTDDFVLTEPGVYTIRISGFIGGTAVDLTFESHEVKPLAELRFP